LRPEFAKRRKFAMIVFAIEEKREKKTQVKGRHVKGGCVSPWKTTTQPSTLLRPRNKR